MLSKHFTDEGLFRLTLDVEQQPNHLLGSRSAAEFVLLPELAKTVVL